MQRSYARDGPEPTEHALTSEPSPAAEPLADAIERLRQVSMRIWERIERELGVSPMQAQVLDAIEQGAAQVSAVATECGRHVSSASRLVDTLVTRGLVTRVEDPTDRRAVRLDLTDDGRVAVRRIAEEHEAFLARVLARLDGDEIRELTRTMLRFAEAAERTAEEVLETAER